MPDPVLMGIAVNLVSSALFELIRDPLFADEAREMPEGGWSPVVEAAMQRAAPLLDAIDPADHAAVEAHLNSTEVRQLVRQIYYSRVDQQAKGLASVRQTFASLWGRRNQPGSLDAFALFDVLVQACEEVLDQAIVSHRPLAAHEAKSAARHNLTSLRLSAIEQQLRLLSAGDAPDLTAIDAFAADVAGAVERRHGSIVPPSLYGALDVPLDDLYVLPTFRLPQGDRSAMRR